MREDSLESVPLGSAHLEWCLEDRPTHDFLTARHGVAAIVLVVVAIKGGSQAPLQIDGVLNLHSLADSRQLIWQELLQQLVFLTKLEEDAADDDIGVVVLEHCLLVLLHHLKFGRVLLSVQHVLRRHAQGNVGDLVVVGEAIITNDGCVTELSHAGSELVTIVLEQNSLQWLPAALGEEVGFAGPLGHGGDDVDGRLGLSGAANSIVFGPAVGRQVVVVLVAAAILDSVGRHGAVADVGLGHALGWHRGVDAGDGQGQGLQLRQRHCQRSFEDHPTDAPVWACSCCGGSAAVPVPIARGRCSNSGSEVHIGGDVVAVAVLDSSLVLRVAQAERAKQSALRAQGEGDAEQHFVRVRGIVGGSLGCAETSVSTLLCRRSMCCSCGRGCLGTVLSSSFGDVVGNGEIVTVEAMLHDEFGGVALSIVAVLRHGLQGELLGLEEAAVDEDGSELAIEVQGRVRWDGLHGLGHIVLEHGGSAGGSQSLVGAGSDDVDRALSALETAREGSGRCQQAVQFDLAASSIAGLSTHSLSFVGSAGVLRQCRLQIGQLGGTDLHGLRWDDVLDIFETWWSWHRAIIGQGTTSQTLLRHCGQVNALRSAPLAGLSLNAIREAHLVEQVAGEGGALLEVHTEHHPTQERVRSLLGLVNNQQLGISGDAVQHVGAASCE
mmetsp:Transcript_36757/g.78046  ORF Transcript_36757/g.78046 Transcript_36757/m.78046 type:complete len:665 (-) Transcript_36757:477-2471(-)